MQGKCRDCENYYLAMKFRKELGGMEGQQVVEVYACTSPDVMSMNVLSGHPFKLDAEGHDIEMLECNSFELKDDKQ